ncbi:MAG: alpha-amylase, partial [Actinomycetaceae bacterium]|nr:alpha-amylase [Actinomycetaceae bacterium]
DRVGGDDDIRPIFPDEPAGLSPLGAPILRLHQDLIGLRRRHPWLVHARTEAHELRNEFYRYAVIGRHGERLEVTLERGGRGVHITDSAGQTLFQV